MKSLTRVLALVAFFAAAAPLVAGADDTADEAEFRFRRAADFYSKGKFDEALSEFFASNRLVRNRNVIFNIARCFEQLGQLNEAYRYYNDLLFEKWSVEDKQALDVALARMRPKVALVRVETRPPGADVFVDRQDLGSRGSSPRTLAMPPGAVTLIAELAGYRSATATVTTEKGRETVVELELERIWSFVRVTTEPAGATIAMEGEPVAPCVSPCELRVPPGRSTLTVALPGYQPLRREIERALDAHLAVDLRLVAKPPPIGKVKITANKENALVLLDGLEAGFTPTVVDAVPIGRHTISVSYDELETWHDTIEVIEGATADVRARLSVPPPQVAAAAKTLLSSDESGASITVISAEEIRAFGYRTLAEALRSVRGLHYSNDRTYEYIGVRGFQPPGDLNTRILLLVDGHPFNDVWAGQAGVGGDFDVDLSQVERIEVVRGPGSALYGSSAVFGVINVVHRTAPRLGAVEAYSALGNLGSVRGRLSAGYDTGRHGASVSVAGLDTTGAQTTLFEGSGNAVPPVPMETVKGHDGEGIRHVSALAHVGGLSLVAALNDRGRQIPTSTEVHTGGIAGAHARDVRGFAELRWEKPIGAAVLNLRAYYDATRYTATYPYPEDLFYYEVDSADWAGLELRLRTGPIFDVHTVTFGAEYQRWLSVKQLIRDSNGVDSLDDNHTADILSLYVLDEVKLSPRLRLEIGTGFRLDTAGGSLETNPSPRGAIVARPYANGLTKLVIGRAFRVPNVYERYYEDMGIGQVIAGPLREESVLTAEIEHTHRVNEEVTATVALFGNRLTRVIELDENENGTVQFRNGALPVEALGAELEVRWQPSRLSLVAFHYAFRVSRDGAEPGVPLTNSPAHLATLRAMYPVVTSVIAALEASYGSGRRVEGEDYAGEALLVNAALSGDLKRYGLHWSLGAYNLLDEKYSYPLGSGFRHPTVQQYGRTFQLALGAGI